MQQKSIGSHTRAECTICKIFCQIDFDHSADTSTAISYSGLTQDGCSALLRMSPPYLCRAPKSKDPPNRTIKPCVVNVQVQPTEACQGAMKNCARGNQSIVIIRFSVVFSTHWVNKCTQVEKNGIECNDTRGLQRIAVHDITARNSIPNLYSCRNCSVISFCKWYISHLENSHRGRMRLVQPSSGSFDQR